MNKGIMRILTTSQCMYDCFFCHKEGIEDPKEELLNSEDILFLYEIYNKYYNKNEIRLSGGEPLLKKDIINIAKKLHEAGCKTYLTTNGFLLKEKIEICKYLQKLNISVHSLDGDKYKQITRKDIDAGQIINHIKEIKEKFPKLDITVDVTLLKGINTNEEIDKYIELAKKLKSKIQFVELFLNNKEYLYEIKTLEKRILDMGFKKIATYIRKNKYEKDDVKIYLSRCFCSVNTEKQNHCDFCNKNNDLFISPDGKIQLCRLKTSEIDILNNLKQKDEKGLLDKIEMAYKMMGKDCLFKD